MANDNVGRLDFSSDGNGFMIRIYDMEGRLTRSMKGGDGALDMF